MIGEVGKLRKAVKGLALAGKKAREAARAATVREGRSKEEHGRMEVEVRRVFRSTHSYNSTGIVQLWHSTNIKSIISSNY